MDHRLLKRQLKNSGITDLTSVPTLQQWNEFLRRVERAYKDADEARYLQERSLEMCSSEMMTRAKELRLSEARWRSLIENSPDVIVLIDQIGKIKFINKEFSSTSQEKLIGKDVTYLFHENDQEWVLNKLRWGIETKAPFSFDIRGAKPEVPFAWMSISVGIVSSGAVTEGLLLNIRDASRQKRAEEKLEAQRAALVQSAKLATLGEMAGGIAHEIRNPLAVIHGLSRYSRKLIEENKIDEERFKLNESKIERMALRISKIVEGLLAFAREGEADPLEDCNAKDVVQDALTLCQEKFTHQGIRLDINEIGKDMVFQARSVQIVQVVVNLLSNAKDAVSELEDRWVSLEVMGDERSVRFIITDSGSGVPESVREKILQPFFTTKGNKGGTGLGLSICLGIAHSHGGVLYLDSDCKNTRFVLEIPRKQTQSSDKKEAA